MVLPLPARSFARSPRLSKWPTQLLCSSSMATRSGRVRNEDMTPRGGLRFAVNRRPQVLYLLMTLGLPTVWTGITAALSLVWLEVMAGRCAPVEDRVKVAGDVTTTMGVRNGRGLVAGL
ncbi:hypothetical protein AOLI_G00217260 [Acnodon oligacanthus]